MITRSHTKGDAPSVAVYSDCERYRYALTRVWDQSASRVVFVMLNPSTATEVQNDPTVERCERRARSLGFGGFRVTNIFAWRDKDPKNMRMAKAPVGPENDTTIQGLHLGRQSDRCLGQPWRLSRAWPTGYQTFARIWSTYFTFCLLYTSPSPRDSR